MGIQKNFVVRNGIEVNNNLIFADSDSGKVGIATTNVQYTLHVNGGIGATSINLTNAIVAGVTTAKDLIINGRVTAGSSFGIAGQYLISTGTGVTWAALPSVRTVDTQTASASQTVFTTQYLVGLLDVYINGVRLSSDEYTANNSINVVLDSPCFGGETVEFVSYSSVAPGAGFTGIQGLTILEEGVQVGSPLQVTSINFVGSDVTATGSGIAVTVYSQSSQWETVASGIATSSNVGIGTTDPQYKLHVGGDVNFSGTLYQNGVAFSGGGSSQWITTGSGISTSSNVGIGTTNPTSKLTVVGNVNVSGIISATSFVGDGSGLTGVGGTSRVNGFVLSYMF